MMEIDGKVALPTWRNRPASLLLEGESLALLLVNTFVRFPESQTFRALLNMLGEVLGSKAIPFLEEMKCACGTDGLGKVMQENIDKPVHRITDI